MNNKKISGSPILQFRGSQDLKDDFEKIALDMGYKKPSGGANSSELLRHLAITFVNHYKKSSNSNEAIKLTMNDIIGKTDE